MKRMIVFVISLITVFSFASCTSQPYVPVEVDVLKEIDENSKQFVPIDWDEVTYQIKKLPTAKEVYVARGEAEGISLEVEYDGIEEDADIFSIIISLSEKKFEEKYKSACKAALMIDEWGLSEEELQTFSTEPYFTFDSSAVQQFSSETAGTLYVIFGEYTCLIYTEKAWELRD